MPLIVLKGCGVNLLGRDWLDIIQLDWQSVVGSKINKTQDVLMSPHISHEIKRKLDSLLGGNRDLFRDQIGSIKGYQAKINIKKDAHPRFMKARNVPFALQEVVNTELDRLVKDNILKPIPFSTWASPIVVIPKPDGGVRICGDFKQTVNPNIESEIYPTPSNDEISTKMQGGEKFSKIDLRQAYLQLELDDEAKNIMVINTNKGLMQYQRMPYGIKPASAIFQGIMDTVLANVPMTGVRTEDILISGRTDEEHLQNLSKVMDLLKVMGVTVRKEKCKFFMLEVEHLGHIISKMGIRVNPEKTEALGNVPVPKNVKELQSFIGGVNYYAKFIPNMATLCKPLYDLLKKGTKWTWDVKQQEAFGTLKSKLISTPILEIYDGQLPVKLDCDASNYGVGAVLSHVYPNGDEKPVAYASRTLNKSEKNYSQLDKEALAIIFAVKKFNQFLYGRRFTLRCDNKALCSIFGNKYTTPVLATSRLIRWSLILATYDFEIEFRETRKHLNADMLSRLLLQDTSSNSVFNLLYETQVGQLPVDAAQIREETLKDENLKQVLLCLQNDSWHYNKSKLDVIYFNRGTELLLQNGVIFWGIRVVLPESLRKSVLTELHCQHPGIVRMKSLARIHVWYPGIDIDIENLVNTCPQCKSVSNAPPKSEQHQWAWPVKPMDRIHFDFFGPYHHKTFLVMVDSFSKWCEVTIMFELDQCVS